MTFNILALITIDVCLSSEKQRKAGEVFELEHIHSEMLFCLDWGE